MKTATILRGALAGILVAGLSACSTIKSWFPDKERDYQFTTEIPELIVPDDLKNKGLASLDVTPSSPEPGIDAGPASVPETAAASSEAVAVDSSASEPAQAAAPVSAASTNVSSLQIDQAKTPATRMVGRALSRQKVEIVERNIEKGYYYVNYDPDAVKASDESIWDELNFMFGDDPSQEREYRITVRGLSPQLSEVTVQDEAGNPLSNKAANALLKLITDGINQVLAEPEGDAGKASGADSTPDAKPESTPEVKPDSEPLPEQANPAVQTPQN